MCQDRDMRKEDNLLVLLMLIIKSWLRGGGFVLQSTEKRRKFKGTESPRGRSKNTPVSDPYPVGVRNYQVAFSPRLHFPSSDNDIDFRNNMRLGASFTDVKSKEVDLESCEKTYKIEKELKSQQEKRKVIQDENQNLQRKLCTVDDLVCYAQKKFEAKEEGLSHLEGEMHSLRRKIKTD